MSGFRFYVGGRVDGAGIGQALNGIDRVVSVWATNQVRRIVQAFRRGGHGDRGGPQWAPWSPAYARNRAKKRRNNILVDTGVLRQSIHYRGTVDAGRINVTIGSNLRYAKYHHYGANLSGKVKGHSRYRGKAHEKAVKRLKAARKKSPGSVVKLKDFFGVASKREKAKVKKSKAKITALKQASEKDRFIHRVEGFTRTGKLPARPIVVFTTSDKQDLATRLNGFLEKAVGQKRRGA